MSFYLILELINATFTQFSCIFHFSLSLVRWIHSNTTKRTICQSSWPQIPLDSVTDRLWSELLCRKSRSLVRSDAAWAQVLVVLSFLSTWPHVLSPLQVQPNNYCTFYDDQRQNWSLMFESEKASLDFCKEVSGDTQEENQHWACDYYLTIWQSVDQAISPRSTSVRIQLHSDLR